MQITRLKLTGFKSFVEPTELRIEKGLTGVVGPNGCGKSNLLEAIRWVMGEGSAKSLRGGAMDDVIFAGTASRPARDFAEVSMLVEEAPGAPGDVEVARRIDRGAGSGYRLNGDDVRAKDVALLFADAATGAHSPALVSQGRIGEIIASKPADRRVMLEEAAGISGLHVRRKDAESKLRATESNLARFETILADMETRIANLKRQARSAEKYRALSAQIRVAEGRMIYARWRSAATAADAAKAEADSTLAEVNTLSSQQEESRAMQARALAALATARATVQSERDAASDATHSLATLRAERDQLKAKIIDIARQADRLAADRAREGQLAEDAASAMATLAQEIATLETDTAQAEPAQQQARARLDSVEAEGRDAEVELARALADQAREQAQAQVAEASFQMAQTQLDRMRREVDTTESLIKNLGTDAQPLAARNEAVQQRRKSEARIAELDTALDQYQNGLTAQAATREEAQSDVARIAADQAALSREASALRAAVDSGIASEKIIHQIKVQPGYERALAAALGDDLEASTKATSPRSWRGSLSHPNDPALPGGSVALLAYVTAPPELARRLSQVLVTDNDEGQRLAVGQRLVTREGVLRRWDGFVAQNQGAVAAERLVRLNRLSELERLLRPMNAQLEDARAALASLIVQAESARTQAEAQRRERESCEATHRNALRTEDQASAELERLATRRTELAERHSLAKAELQQALAAHEVARQARIEVDHDSLTHHRVAGLAQHAEELRAAIAEARAHCASLAQQLETQRARLRAAQAEQQDWHTRAAAADDRIGEMARRAQAAEAEAMAMATRPATLDVRIAQVESERESRTVALETARAAEDAAQAVLAEIETALNVRGETLAQARERRAGAQARAENEELRRIEMGRVSGERFECPPPLLPQVAGFVDTDVGAAQDESTAHERLLMERERIGPVNLIAEQEMQALEAERSTRAAE
ncbi:MAG: AAA family ATPase, partial [Alphaproteobacteria bacterium]|nr:AAA family ATPase [Alphaproteobacteria bacterium]